MHFSHSTIAAVAALLATTAEARPHGWWFWGHNNDDGDNGYPRWPGWGDSPEQESSMPVFPTVAPSATGMPSGIPSGVFPPSGGSPTGTGAISAPVGPTAGPTAPPTIPSDVSSVSFELPTETAVTEEDDDEDSDDDEEDTPTSTIVASPTSGSGNSTSPVSSSAPAVGLPASSTFPEAAGESTLSEPMVVTGEFDGGMVRFGRGVECTGQSEGGDSDAVFQVEEGGVLKNVIIGADQSEGVHCMGSCTIENVWWEAVCEDALTIKQESGTSTVTGGGAKGAEDKVIQHNGGGTVSIAGFYVSDFGKLYRSCGNCDEMFERHVEIDGVIADGGSATLVGINSNYGDTATITNSCITNTDTICKEFEGNDTGDEPESISEGPSGSCIYTEADISAC